MLGKLLHVLILAGFVTTVAGCNTVAGAGEDVSALGRGVTSGAEKTEDAMSGDKE